MELCWLGLGNSDVGVCNICERGDVCDRCDTGSPRRGSTLTCPADGAGAEWPGALGGPPEFSVTALLSLGVHSLGPLVQQERNSLPDGAGVRSANDGDEDEADDEEFAELQTEHRAAIPQSER